ncbi:MAG: TIGR04282 family arsenosugar biosynthesis glycosyltransferase [Saprospiraceae bacterium]
MNTSTQTALIIFIKNPEKGKVKTRLASTVGDDRALEIYKALMSHTRDLASQTEANRYLFYSQFINAQDDWPENRFIKDLQIEGDLGAKMATAFQTVLAKHAKAIIIGSDCASLTQEIIQEAIQALDQHDFVLGPALDGGYYLLGMQYFEPTLFQDMPWSTEQVAPITKTRIKALGKTCFTLQELSDIDYEEDWNKYGWDLS